MPSASFVIVAFSSYNVLFNPFYVFLHFVYAYTWATCSSTLSGHPSSSFFFFSQGYVEIRTRTRGDIHRYIHTYVHTYIHTCPPIPTYLQVHTYLPTGISCACSNQLPKGPDTQIAPNLAWSGLEISGAAVSAARPHWAQRGEMANLPTEMDIQ